MPYADPVKQREYHRKRWRRLRAEFFADKVCAHCGSADALELDHIDGSTKVSHSIWSWSAKRRAEELAKCQVLCSPCHDEKCEQEGHPRTPQHGTPTRYRKGCRCEPCKAAKSEQRKKERARSG